MTRQSVFTLIVVGLVLAAGVDRSYAQDEARHPDAKAIESWIADLDSDRYEVRERATRQLAEHGHLALDGLASAADGQRAEAAARAIAILEELTQAGDSHLKLKALERLAALVHKIEVSRRAQERLANVWCEVALPIAIELGGRLDPTFPFVDEATGRPRKFILGRDWTGGDEGLDHVARLNFVSTLSLRHIPVTAEGLERLADMPLLTSLELYGLDLSDDELGALRKALPNVVEFDVRSGAMLGVHGLPTALTAQVTQVQPDSAAEKAGLQAGDVIVKVDDNEVATFTDLTAEIAKRQPEESAVLTIRRDDQLIERTVTFGYWE